MSDQNDRPHTIIYQAAKLGELAAAIKLFDIDDSQTKDGRSRSIYIRNKRRRSR